MPNLYVVATPIGNLEDISLRALRILREVKLIAAEDTRKTKRLLNAYHIQTPMTSYHEHNKKTKLDYILNCLKEGDVALVSEAGMPGISDPGYELIGAANQNGIPVIPIPGPSAVITALAVSGLPTDRFLYLGFLPRRASARKQALKSVAQETGTMVILEAPHRLQQALSDLRLVLGDRRLAVCRELTKLHEEVFRGAISQAIDRFIEPRGEFTLVIEGKREEKPQKSNKIIEKRLRDMYQNGVKAKEAIASVAGETGLSRRELYRTWLEMNKASDEKPEYMSQSGEELSHA
ncbi:MAG: 16S rRNA (cytidine(1402)-2'-O)-methyltransferase [Dehalococcoidales bacterium]|nr:16S rRNA (cytidine(1402)-2'-O)-methyltransferase [Dehalococcoidales bacterium]